VFFLALKHITEGRVTAVMTVITRSYCSNQFLGGKIYVTENSNAQPRWDDSDFASMKMDHFCREIRDSLDKNDQHDKEQPVRILRLWQETWERKKGGPRGDTILEARLTAKYQGLKFYDIDADNRVMIAHRMVFRKERGTNTYDVFATLPGFNVELPDDSQENDDFWQPWEVNEDLFDCLRAYYNDVQEDNIKTYDIGEGCDSDSDTE
jgi:hypothetical protein